MSATKVRVAKAPLYQNLMKKSGLFAMIVREQAQLKEATAVLIAKETVGAVLKWDKNCRSIFRFWGHGQSNYSLIS
jgi:hypothetical protein